MYLQTCLPRNTSKMQRIRGRTELFMARTGSMPARMPVEPGMKKSRTEIWVGINGVGEVVLLSVAIVRRVDKVTFA
jgi:hypothetical protein